MAYVLYLLLFIFIYSDSYHGVLYLMLYIFIYSDSYHGVLYLMLFIFIYSDSSANWRLRGLEDDR